MTDETDFSHLAKLHFGGAERTIRDGGDIPAKELAILVRSCGDTLIPASVIEHMCAHLDGEVSKRKGRPAKDEHQTWRRDIIVTAEYRRLLGVLQAGSLSTEDIEVYGPAEPSDATPAEQAARLVAGMFLNGAESWHSVQNIASSQK